MSDDEFVFQRVYETFQPKILRYLKRLAGEEEAEDLTQEVFVKVSRSLGGFRGEARLSTWLYRIATNAALDRLRSPSYQRVVQKDLSNAPEESRDAEPEDRNTWTGESIPLVEQQVFRKEMNECIQGYVTALPESDRTILVLSEFEGLGNEEIAEILGVSPGAVKTRLHRARERLREKLANHCDPYWVENNEFVPELKRKGRKGA